MANPFFEFKQFKIIQDQSAMKVCTDSCILGAFATFPDPERILDIGTGTGLLSLMLAQKYGCEIDAVEIDAASAHQADSNFKASPWASRILLSQQSIQQYQECSRQPYDLIVCNPPFFNNHLKSPNLHKNLAIHNDELPFEILVKIVGKLLSPNGLFYNLLPWYESQLFDKVISQHSLFPHKKLNIYNQENKPVFRVITAYSKKPKDVTVETLVIKNNNGEYSDFFKHLLKDYYLYL